MTRYDDDRVVTLLREVDLPAAPADRLTQVGRRARARESRMMTGLAGVLAIVLVGGVLGVTSLRDSPAGGDALTVAGAVDSTTDAGTARVTIRIDFSGLEASMPAGMELPRDPHLSGLVDFVHQRFVLRGNLTGQATEQRGIGRDRWDRVGAGRWEHSTDPSSGDFDDVDPSTLLSKLTTSGKTLSTSRKGDRTVFRLRVPQQAVFGSGQEPGTVDATVEVDDQGLVRELATTTASAGVSITFTISYDDFGIDVDVQRPPADQVVERPRSQGSGGSVELDGEVSSETPESACAMLPTLEQQRSAGTDEQQKRAFEQMVAALRKKCAEK